MYYNLSPLIIACIKKMNINTYAYKLLKEIEILNLYYECKGFVAQVVHTVYLTYKTKFRNNVEN